MVVQFLEVVDIFVFGVFVGFVVATVEESLAVVRPGCAGKFNPFEMVCQILTGIYIPHLPLLPVGTGTRQAVSHELAVFANGISG